MIGGPAERDGEAKGQRPLLHRLGWFFAIWAGSVAALAVVAFLIKLAL